jgi:hypothetical protein
MKKATSYYFDSFGYNLFEEHLTIQLSDETRYTYANVPEQVFLDLVNARDEHDYFIRKIKDKYKLIDIK